MKRKKRYIARMDEVTINREGEVAVISYKEEGVPTTRVTIGPGIVTTTDEGILELFNDVLRAQAQLVAEFQYVAEGVQLGLPPIKHRRRANRWTLRGGVLRCLISTDAATTRLNPIPSSQAHSVPSHNPRGNSLPHPKPSAVMGFPCGAQGRVLMLSDLDANLLLSNPQSPQAANQHL